MSKSKNRATTTTPARTDIHAISPLPIEFIQQRLQQLSKRGLTVKFADLNNDGIAFQLKHPEMRSIVTGTLRRWEGTHTRVDAQTTMQLPPDWIEWVVHLVVIFLFFLWFGGCSLLMGFFSIFTFVGAIVMATVFALLLPISQFFDRFRKQALKDADKQMQLIVLLLTSNLPAGTQPFVEFDGTEQSLEAMLRRQQSRNSK